MGHQGRDERVQWRARFDTYIETQLAPALDPGTVVILDNLSTHKSPRAAQALRERGCWFLFLPAYSPDLNPIEMAFSKLKAHLRRIGARTFDALFEALLETSVTCSIQMNAGTSSKLRDMPQIKCKAL